MDTPETPTTPVTTPAATPIDPAKTAQPAPTVGAAPGPSGERKLADFATKDIGKIRKDGERRARSAIAKTLGVDPKDLDAKLAELAKKPATPTPPATAAKPTAPAKKPTASDDPETLRQQFEQLQRERDRATQAARHGDRRARQAKAEAEKQVAVAQLQLKAALAGVADSEYAITLLQRHVATLTQEQVQALDEGAFFAGLRESHPHLFPSAERGVTTGSAAARPKPPTPAAASKGAQPAKVDYRTAPRATFIDKVRNLTGRK